MNTNHSLSLSAMLITSQRITHCHHAHGWIEAPDGRQFQPSASKVQFIAGMGLPFMSRKRKKPRWFARLMGIFA